MNGAFRLRGPRKFWLAGGIFAGIGLLVGFVLPPILVARAAPDGQILVGVLRALGAAFLTLGTMTLLMAVLVPEIERAAPRNAPVWEWWMEFVGGALGAAMFGVPATLMLPLMAFLYIDRPNWAFPDPEATFWPQGYLGVLFTTLGLITLVSLIFLGRISYRQHPRWRR